ncbi:adenylate kinase [Amycolatopsis balhimycina DSM 5908]|uniref:Adenylate kinase n=1 Tax=Amycolatopsis balhimycina DSM 5908 TaxID=1081091 RepID=A0A428WG64_AMYBA|nr:(d)CMP kinase [Amycolatopsis balhimycina]RSM42042.1 adenylate kinase [Amycolatopsis balhimycina DSM 5908]
MRVIGPDEPLGVLRRIAVAGSAGSGKSTLARTLCERLGVPFVEMETFFHGPGWTVRETWQADLLEYLGRDVWAIEWQGEEVRERMTARLDVLVWLDHPRALAMVRVVIRTLQRRFGRGSEIAGGNVEGPLRTFFTDRNHIIRLAWRYHPIMRARVRRVIDENSHPDLVVVRLRGQRQVNRWLRGPVSALVGGR